MRKSFIAKLVFVLMVFVVLALIMVRARSFDQKQACKQDITNTVYICK